MDVKRRGQESVEYIVHEEGMRSIRGRVKRGEWNQSWKVGVACCVFFCVWLLIRAEHVVSYSSPQNRPCDLQYSPPEPVQVAVERTARSQTPTQKGPKYGHIIVYGLESSGTKFVSASIYEAIKSKSERWDGGSPACVMAQETGTRIYHFSLPFGSFCTDKMKVNQLTKEQACDVSLNSYSKRWITNVTYQMTRSPDTAAVIVLRDFTASLRSKVSSRHCLNVTISRQEHELSRAVIQEAIEQLGPHVFVLSYESLQYSVKHEFIRMWQFLGIDTTYVPAFRDRNFKHVKHIEPPKELSRVELIAKGRSAHS